MGAIVCGAGDPPCPNDPDFVHMFYFGCVPADLNESTGRSATYKQIRKHKINRVKWNGGCDAALLENK